MRSHRIIVVEDDPGVCETLVDILEDHGHEVVAVPTVARSRALPARDDYAAALVDVSLPDGSGIDAARELRTRFPRLGVVFLTANASLESAIRAVELGATRYLQKPCHPTTVLRVLDEILDRRLLEDEAAAQKRRVEVAYELLSGLIDTLDIGEIAALGARTLAGVTGAQTVVVAPCPERLESSPAHFGVDDPGLLALGTNEAWLSELTEGCEVGGFIPIGTNRTAICLGLSVGSPLGVALLAHDGPLRDPELVKHIAQQLASGLHQGMLHAQLQVAYEHLQQTQQTLVETEKQSAVGRLAAGIAHEIGTPLNIISGRAEVLLGRTEPETPIARGLTIICGQIDRIALLVRQLLDYSRAESSTERSAIRLSSVLADTLPLVETRAMKRTCGIDNRINADTPAVLASFHRLQQVLLNLLLNAMDAGASRITIDARPDDDHPEQLLVQVVDDGSGIDPDMLVRVFEPFYTTKGRGEGTGLGLAVAREIIRDHRGDLWAENAADGGACFSMRLPLA